MREERGREAGRTHRQDAGGSSSYPPPLRSALTMCRSRTSTFLAMATPCLKSWSPAAAWRPAATSRLAAHACTAVC